VFDSPINGDSFLCYVEQFLVPTLTPPGSHKGQAVRKSIIAAGAGLVFLPAFSPGLNPIEQVFAKLKHFLRKAKGRSVKAKRQRAGAILPSFTPQECSNYFTNAGHGSR
jgi:transposase